MERTYFVGRKFTEYAINIRLKELNVAKIVKILVHEVRDLAENVFQGHAMRRRNARALLSRHVMTTVSDLDLGVRQPSCFELRVSFVAFPPTVEQLQSNKALFYKKKQQSILYLISIDLAGCVRSLSPTKKHFWLD